MVLDKIIRAWKDPEYRASLSDEEQAALPAHPAGAIELTDEELEMATGGHGPYSAYHFYSNSASRSNSASASASASASSRSASHSGSASGRSFSSNSNSFSNSASNSASNRSASFSNRPSNKSHLRPSSARPSASWRR